MTRHRLDPARRRQRRIGWGVVATALVLYLGVGWWLSAHDLIFPDAMSRVANGYYTMRSRDPHLAAIGFVWNPLPSLAVIPLLLLTPIWPTLASKAVAGCLVSVACGAVTAGLMHRLLALLGSHGPARILLTAAFALHPLVLLGATTGASEAMLLLTCAFMAVRLALWLGDPKPWLLVQVGVGAGVAYLVRYEALAAGAAIAVLVAGASWWRSRGRKGGDGAIGIACLDVALVIAPIAAAFGLWALASKIVVGSWLETFTSQYGNSAQVGAFRASIDGIVGTGGGAQLAYVSEQLLRTAPLAIPLTIIALVVAWRRREPALLAPVFVFGSILLFQNLAFLRGMSFGWIRFQIAAVPLAILAAGYLVAAVGSGARGRRARRALAVGLVAAVVLVLPLAWVTEADPRFGREEVLAREVAGGDQYGMEAAVARDIKSMGLGEGAVITDVAYSFPIILASQEPKVFTITTDRDFEDRLADPGGASVLYALVSAPDSAPADAVDKAYPGMWENGAGVATLAREWKDGRGLTWRLYRFNDA
ncbi:ABC transporter [Actinomyces sp. zg296]|uniref:ABC transporter n=1 Tax=Actinomyces sp. zg296 TaxID=2609289 RepID=UPI0013574393|nr:ABC transporter [Actinomyces sp. zg296]